jgi:glycogen debranching enzyme
MTHFNPLGYHTGSVWPHDTAMAVQGLYGVRQAVTATSTATKYVRGLVDAAEAFNYRLPELYGGAGSEVESRPTPYPLSCFPQAWAAASAIAVLVAALGIEPNVPAGTLDIMPANALPWRSLRVEGVRVGERTLTVQLEGGVLTVTDS